MKRFLLFCFLLMGLTAHGQRFVKYVDNLAALRALNPNDVHTTVKVLGHTTKNDGGEGEFYYDSADTTATTSVYSGVSQKPTSFNGRWRRIWDGVNAKVAWWGAFPNDSTDDATAIQATIDYLHGIKRGNAILDQGGIYDQGSTIYLKYRVNLIGQNGYKKGELMSSSPSSDIYLMGGPTQLKMMDSMESDMVVLYSPDGYLQQTETIEDGTLGDGRYCDNSIENIVFRGNINYTGNNIWHGIVARQKWSVNIHECGFIYIKGNYIHFWDINYATVRDVWAKGRTSVQPNLGMFVYSTADSTFDNIIAGGFQGPAMWFNGQSTWWNLSSQLFLYNQFTTNTVFPASSVATTGIFTFASSIPIATGQQIELRTDGTLPSPYTDTQLYWAVRLSSTTYGIHTNYAQATNGVYLSCSGGSGTHSFTIGPASGIYMSGGARNNVFGTIRVDQNSGPGLVIRDADANLFSAVTASRNTGSDNLETVYENDKAGALIDKGADNNIIHATINDSTYGFATRGNASGNILNGVMHTVTVARTNGSSAVNNEYLKLPSNNAVSWGDTSTQTALALSGNASGVRVLTLERPSLSQKIGIGVAPGGFTFYDETAARTIGQLTYDGTTYRQIFGGAQASPKEARVVGNAGSGTDAAGGDLTLEAGAGTGAGTTGGRIRIVLPVVGASSSTAQSTGYRGGWEREGQFSLYNFTADPIIGLADGNIWYRSDTDKLRLRANSVTENIATESYVTSAISGSGALTDGDKGDITVSGTGTVFTIDNSAVTYAKMQNVSAVSKLLGRNSTTTGPPEEITLGSGLSMSGTTLSVTAGGGNVSNSGTPTSGQAAEWVTSTTIQGVSTTGSGNYVKATSPTLTTPTLGAATATSINGVTIAGASTPALTVTGTTSISGTHSGTSSGSNTGDQTITLTSDVTGSGTGSFATTISSGAVTYSKMQNVSAASKLLGRGSAAGAGSPQEITIGAGLTMSGTTLTASGATVADSDYGDITVSGSGTFWSIDNSAVTYAKIQDMSATRMLGRKTASGVGPPEELTVSDILDWTSGAAPAFGDVLFRGASTWQRLAPGTSGQFLQTQGVGASPQWAAPSVAGSALTGSSLAAGITSSSLTSFGSSPTLTTPNIGVATATSVNKVAITAPATSATLTIADGKTATVNNSITFAGTDSTTMTFPPVTASIGYLNVPQGSKSADYTLVLADAGTHIFHPSSDANSRTFTIPANASVAFPLGTVVTFYNASANSCTLAITTDTLRKATTGTTGSVTIPQYGLATIMKVTTTEWIVNGL